MIGIVDLDFEVSVRLFVDYDSGHLYQFFFHILSSAYCKASSKPQDSLPARSLTIAERLCNKDNPLFESVPYTVLDKYCRPQGRQSAGLSILRCPNYRIVATAI